MSLNHSRSTSSQPNDLKPIQVKLVLLGEAAVGKSSLVTRFVNNDFQEHREPTIGGILFTHNSCFSYTKVSFGR
jgi:Ras-related protein Rab-5C